MARQQAVRLKPGPRSGQEGHDKADWRQSVRRGGKQAGSKPLNPSTTPNPIPIVPPPLASFVHMTYPETCWPHSPPARSGHIPLPAASRGARCRPHQPAPSRAPQACGMWRCRTAGLRAVAREGVAAAAVSRPSSGRVSAEALVHCRPVKSGLQQCKQRSHRTPFPCFRGSASAVRTRKSMLFL